MIDLGNIRSVDAGFNPRGSPCPSSNLLKEWSRVAFVALQAGIESIGTPRLILKLIAGRLSIDCVLANAAVAKLIIVDRVGSTGIGKAIAAIVGTKEQ